MLGQQQAEEIRGYSIERGVEEDEEGFAGVQTEI